MTVAKSEQQLTSQKIYDNHSKHYQNRYTNIDRQCSWSTLKIIIEQKKISLKKLNEKGIKKIPVYDLYSQCY